MSAAAASANIGNSNARLRGPFYSFNGNFDYASNLIWSINTRGWVFDRGINFQYTGIMWGFPNNTNVCRKFGFHNNIFTRDATADITFGSIGSSNTVTAMADSGVYLCAVSTVGLVDIRNKFTGEQPPNGITFGGAATNEITDGGSPVNCQGALWDGENFYVSASDTSGGVYQISPSGAINSTPFSLPEPEYSLARSANRNAYYDFEADLYVFGSAAAVNAYTFDGTNFTHVTSLHASDELTSDESDFFAQVDYSTTPPTRKDFFMARSGTSTTRNFTALPPIANIGSKDHNISSWYCFVNTTVTYGIPNNDTIIYKSDVDGTNETVVVSSSSEGSAGTFSATAGKLYYGSKAVGMISENTHSYLAPVSNKGRKFAIFADRSSPHTFRIFNPNQTSATVKFYENTASGIASTETGSVVVAGGSSGTYTQSSSTNDIWIWVYSESVDVVITSNASNSGDQVIMNPAGTTVYARNINKHVIDMENNTPVTVGGNYAVDNTHQCVIHATGDGAGSDAAQHMPIHSISDVYVYGKPVVDFQIVQNTANAVVTVSYWNGSAWTVYNTYTASASASTTNPTLHDVGTASGNGPDLISGTNPCWKWEGTSEFALFMNDTVAAEFAVHGHMSNKIERPGNRRNGIVV